MPITKEDFDNRFTYHAPDEHKRFLYETIRNKAKDLGKTIVASAPDSRELSLAITKLEEVVMWANAAIARN